MDASTSHTETSNGQIEQATPQANEAIALLAARRDELREQLATLAEEDSETAHPRFSNHLAEDAQDQQEFQGAVARRYLMLNELRQVEYALTRASSGQYGVCEDCGRKIPPRRLQIIPAATLCVACQGQREARQIAH
jgi:DnaK suppressor protein